MAALLAGRAEDAWQSLRDAPPENRRKLPQRSQSIEHLTQLGTALLARGENAEAAQRLRRAVEIQPGEAVLHYNLSVALTGNRQFEDAVEQLRIAVRLDPSLASAHLNLGICWSRGARTTPPAASSAPWRSNRTAPSRGANWRRRGCSAVTTRAPRSVSGVGSNCCPRTPRVTVLWVRFS